MSYDFKNEKVRSLGGRVHVKLVKPPSITEGGIHLLDNQVSSDVPGNRGEVLSVGDDVKLNIKIGDVIVFDPRGLDPYVRRNFKDDEEAFINHTYIFAVIEK